MASKQHQYICLYFARGKCIQGANCTYYHRIPTAEDEKTLPLTNDIFGRDRHAYVNAGVDTIYPRRVRACVCF